MTRKTKSILAAGAAIGALALFLALGGSGRATTGDATVTSLPSPMVVAPGKVEPRSEEIRVAAAITGRLAEVRVEEGQRVAAGEILAIVGNAEHLARVHQAEASLRLQQAALKRLLNGPRGAERREVHAAVEEARAVLSQATAELERQDALTRAGHASRQAFDRAQREYQVAKARLEATIHRRDAVDTAARSDDVEVAEAQVALAEGRLAELRAAYDRTFVRSPVDGLVLRIQRRVGEMVSESVETPIVSVGDDSVLRVRTEVDEADIARLGLGQPAYVTAPGYGDARFAGRVTRIGSMMGRKTIRTEQPAERVDTRVLEVMIDLQTRDLPSGLRVDAFLTPVEPRSALHQSAPQ